MNSTYDAKTASQATHRPLAGTLEGPEKVREGHPSNLPAPKKDDNIALPEILRYYYGYWLGGHWTSFEDVQDAGAGG